MLHFSFYWKPSKTLAVKKSCHTTKEQLNMPPLKYPTSQTQPFSPLASRQRTPQRALQRAHPQPRQHQHQQLKRPPHPPASQHNHRVPPLSQHFITLPTNNHNNNYSSNNNNSYNSRNPTQRLPKPQFS
jgi:hypothetical protein